MGFVIITESGTFEPSYYGLKIGDILNIICVGGGAGGQGGSHSGTTSNTTVPTSGFNAGTSAGFGSGGKGGSGATYANTNDDKRCTEGGNGGGSGEIVISTYKLSTLNSIPVTIGSGGKGGSSGSYSSTIGNVGTSGQPSSFGDIVVAQGGICTARKDLPTSEEKITLSSDPAFTIPSRDVYETSFLAPQIYNGVEGGKGFLLDFMGEDGAGCGSGVVIVTW